MLYASPAGAQIVTDRPDFVESSATVGAGTVQIEGSVAYARDGDMAAWTTPTLVRIGAGDRFELRAESDLLVHERTDGASASGIADLSVGVKAAVADGFGLLGHLDLPTGSEEWRGEGVRPSLRAVVERKLPHDFGLGVMPGVFVDEDAEGRYAAGLLGIVIGKGWSDRLRSFVELGLEQIAADEDGGTVGSWNVGGALLLSENAQLDAALSFGATSSSTPFALTVGYSHRFARGSTPR